VNDREGPVSNSIVQHSHDPGEPCPDGCPKLYVREDGGPSWAARHSHLASEPCGPMCPGNPAKPGGNGGPVMIDNWLGPAFPPVPERNRDYRVPPNATADEEGRQR
jgi:hypothetical protein